MYFGRLGESCLVCETRGKFCGLDDESRHNTLVHGREWTTTFSLLDELFP